MSDAESERLVMITSVFLDISGEEIQGSILRLISFNIVCVMVADVSFLLGFICL